MASSPMHCTPPGDGVDERPEQFPDTVRPRETSEVLSIQDVTVPLQLLRATGNIGSLRDRKESITWEPQPSRPSFSEGRVGSSSRRDTQTSYVLDRAATLSSRNEKSRLSNRQQRGSIRKHSGDEATASPPLESEQVLGPSPYRQLSYIPGSNDVLSATPKTSRPVTRDTSRPTPASSIWSTADPFSMSKNSINADDAQTTVGPHAASSGDANNTYNTQARRGTLQSVVDAILPDVIQRRLTTASYARKSSMWQTYEKAKERGVQLQRNRYVQVLFEYSIYAILILFIYFVLVGVPLWKGAVYWLWWVVAHKFVITGGFSITLGIALFYAFAPLLILFEKDPPPPDHSFETKTQPNVQDTALLIPCYKSAGLIAATLEAALKVFPPSHVFVIANGNSPTPLDNTEEVCRPYKVNHIWSPIGSKIVAQFVGCYAAKSFKNVLLIDDDCALPENFPVVTERLVGEVQCVGYTIKSVGPNSSKGNLCQQAQDLEYKLSGIQREFAGRVGSATFPHGAISLWDRQLLVKTFHEHPGFSVSEDWFFGHVARKLGCRIKMCSHVFVETETPTAVFFSSGGSRGGFGEMTIFQQRFKRWNFFFVNGMWYNMAYIFGSWKLGWWEIGAKIFVFQEVYETLLYLLTPFILPISFYVRPSFCGILLASTIVLYLINVIIFNEIHLRRKNERLGWVLLYVYYLPYKIVLTGINVASCYWSLWKYARYFAKRHPKVTEDEKAVEVVIRLEEEAASAQGGLGRRMTVRTIGKSSQTGMDDNDDAVSPMQRTDTGIYRVITQPEPAHVRMNTPTMQREGIRATDYFFGNQERTEIDDLEKGNEKIPRKNSFGA